MPHRPNKETIHIDDMRLFAAVADAKSFTGAARSLGVPKQTVSRRVGALEAALGVDLMHRTTRKLELTDVGVTYARRCAEIVRLAGEANRAATDEREVPRGTLRLTADPVFGDAFVSALVVEYAKRWPETRLEVVLTRRHVDLVEERFDLAFRVGRPDDATLAGVALGAARIRFCASPSYAKRRGVPMNADDVARHDCVVVSDGGPARWPVPTTHGTTLIGVAPRLALTSFEMARAAVLAGLGIGLFPEFACAADLRRKRLVPVFGGRTIDVGSIWLLHPLQRFLPPRVRAFVELARSRFAAPPWEPTRGRRAS